MSTNWFTAGKSTDRLIYNCLENRCRQIFTCCAFVDQWLNIGFCKYTATGCNWIDCFVILGIFIEPGSIRLNKRSHLVNERTGTTGTDTIHTLLNITAFKIYNFGIFTTELDRHICLRGIVLKCCRNRDYLLYKRNLKMLGEGETAGTGDHWSY